MSRIKLILLPGLDGTGRLFDPLCSHLPDCFDPFVIAYPPVPESDYINIARRVHSQIPNSEPIVLLAESFSGPIAISIAAQRPKNLVAVILCASFVQNPTFLSPRLAPFLTPTWIVRWISRRRFVWRFLLRSGTPPELLGHFVDTIQSVPPIILAQRLRMVFSCDAKSALRNVAVPILYLQATRDYLVQKSHATLIASLNSNTKITGVNAGHFMLQTNPRDSIAEVVGFLRQLAVI